MKNSLFLITVLCLGGIFSSCKKDFSVNAQYEDFPIVLGLLNPAETTHYLKIYKSFITENSAYDAAKDIHLYSYIDSVEVYMEERDANDRFIRKILFDTTTEIPKEAGIFAYPTQILYKTDAELNRDYTYKLFIYNPYTEKMAYSQPIDLVWEAKIASPLGTELSITDKPFSLKYIPAQNAYLYEFVVTFYYSETRKGNIKQEGKPIVWNMGQQSFQTSGVITSPSTSGAFFFQRIAANIIDNEDVTARHVDSIVISIYTAGKDWYLYLFANHPSSGINQNRLDYTNISAYNTVSNEEKYALGIFSSRAVSTRMFRDLTLPSGSKDSLFHGRFTGHLKFTDIY